MLGVIPAKAGIHDDASARWERFLDSRLRGNDTVVLADQRGRRWRGVSRLMTCAVRSWMTAEPTVETSASRLRCDFRHVVLVEFQDGLMHFFGRQHRPGVVHCLLDQCLEPIVWRHPLGLELKEHECSTQYLLGRCKIAGCDPLINLLRLFVADRDGDLFAHRPSLAHRRQAATQAAGFCCSGLSSTPFCARTRLIKRVNR